MIVPPQINLQNLWQDLRDWVTRAFTSKRDTRIRERYIFELECERDNLADIIDSQAEDLLCMQARLDQESARSLHPSNQEPDDVLSMVDQLSQIHSLPEYRGV